MVGEIRDSETAEIAIRAALTGHQVFSTLHTNDSTGAVTRLVDMGVETFLISSSLEGVLAQRLVRQNLSPLQSGAPRCPRSSATSSMRWAPGGWKAFFTKAGMRGMPRHRLPGRVGMFELLVIGRN
jgi:type II secretory ATPase GspE/PulE/Tfp pilus assembly ATPase PilB-like protein